MWGIVLWGNGVSQKGRFVAVAEHVQMGARAVIAVGKRGEVFCRYRGWDGVLGIVWSCVVLG